MSANAQTSTEAGPKPPAVAANSGAVPALTNGSAAGKKNNAANAGKKGENNGNNANAEKKTKNGNNGNTEKKTKNDNTDNAEEAAQKNNGKNPTLEKITESLSALEGAMAGANCGDIQTKAKKVIENADPVIEAIEKQELRENNSQLTEVKGKVKSVTNSIRQKCPKGAAANAAGTNAPYGAEPPNAKCKTLLESKGITDRSSFRTWSLTAHPNKGGDEEEFKEVSSCANSLPAKGQSPVKEKPGQEQALPKVGQQWNVITSWATGNTRTGYDAIVKITSVDEKGVTFEAVKVNQTANMNKNGMKPGDTRTYTMEEWKALRKVLDKNANNSAAPATNTSTAAPATNTSTAAPAANTAAAPKQEQTESKQEGGRRKTRRHKRKSKKSKSRRMKRTR